MLKKENKILTIELWKANEYINSLCMVKGVTDIPVFGGEEFWKMDSSPNEDLLPPLSGSSPSRKRSPTKGKASLSPDKSERYYDNDALMRKIEKAKQEAFERIMHSANMVKEVL